MKTKIIFKRLSCYLYVFYLIILCLLFSCRNPFSAKHPPINSLPSQNSDANSLGRTDGNGSSYVADEVEIYDHSSPHDPSLADSRLNSSFSNSRNNLNDYSSGSSPSYNASRRDSSDASSDSSLDEASQRRGPVLNFSDSDASSDTSGHQSPPTAPVLDLRAAILPAELTEMITEADLGLCPNIRSNRKTVDLRAEIGEQRHQDGFGWCYAYSASDLMTQYLQRNRGDCLNPPLNVDFRRRENMVSPASLAANEAYVMQQTGNFVFINGDPSNIAYEKAPLVEMNGRLLESRGQYLSGGDADDAIRNSSGANERFPDMRFCLEGQYPSEAYMGGDESSPDYFNYCIENFSQWQYLTDNIINMAGKIQRLPSQSGSPCKMTFKADRRPIVKHIRGDNERSWMKHARALASKFEVAMAMNELLERGNIVQVNFSSSVLRNPNGLAMAPRTADHAATVVGKKINPKTCKVEYLLRDSQGLQCSSYNLRNGEKKGHLRCERNQGRGVTLFVDEEFFQKHLESINYIENL